MGTQLLAVLVATVLAAQSAPSEPVAERIARGEALIEQLEYEEGAQELMLALGDPRSTDDELLKANLLAGIANRVLDRNVEARLNFHYVLTRAPSTQLPPETAPKIATFFELVRREVEAEKVAKVADDAPAAPDEVAEPVAAATPAPVPAPDEVGLGAFFWSGAIVLGASAGLAALFVGGALAGEIVLNMAEVPGDTKGIFGIVGQASLLFLLLTPIGLFAGGALLGWGLIE
jgi:hypothetical protein